MESYKKLVVVLGLVAVALAAAEVANGEFTVCGMPYSTVMSCKPAVTGAKPVDPSGVCCDGLKSADLKCFCDLLKSYSNGNANGVNLDRVKQLPGLCKMSTSFQCS